MTRSPAPSNARRRPTILVVIDVVAGILLSVLGAGFAIGVFTTAFSYGGLHAMCGAGDADGMICNTTVLSIVVYGLMAVSVLAIFLGFGMFVVNLIRKKYGFYWPLVAIVLTLVLFYLGSWVAGMTVPA